MEVGVHRLLRPTTKGADRQVTENGDKTEWAAQADCTSPHPGEGEAGPHWPAAAHGVDQAHISREEAPVSVPIRRGWPTLLILAFVAIGAVACDPGHPVTYENRTDRAVKVFINGKFSASLEPMNKEKFELIEFGRATFEARDSDGRVIYSETFTWEELKEADWRIVITEPTPTPSAQSSSLVGKRP